MTQRIRVAIAKLLMWFAVAVIMLAIVPVMVAVMLSVLIAGDDDDNSGPWGAM